MTEEKKVIVIDEVEYAHEDLSDSAKVCLSHITSLQQKISSSEFNLFQLQAGEQYFKDRLRESLKESVKEVNEE